MKQKLVALFHLLIQGYLIIALMKKAFKKMINIVPIETLVIIIVVVLCALLMNRIIPEKSCIKKCMRRNLFNIWIIKYYKLNKQLLIILFIQIDVLSIFYLLIKYYLINKKDYKYLIQFFFLISLIIFLYN